MAQPTAFGALLKRYRLARGFTQEDLAARAGYSTVYVSMLERGRRLPLPSTLTSLCEALALAPRDRAALHAVVRPQEDGAALRQALVGRPHEQASVDHHLSGEGPPLFLLAGEPGIGKSRLLQEVARRAVGYGLRVLEGGCQRRGGQEPYAPVLGALQHHIRGQSSAQLAQDVRGCAWLVRLLPELAEGPIEPLPNWTVAPAQERRLVFEAVTRFLTNVAAPAGTLLVLDDLQWADPDALDLLALLGRAAAEIPLRIVGAYRDTEARPQDALSTTLADLAHAGLVRQITLSPLPDQAAAQLLDRLLQDVEGTTEALRDRVLQRAAGVPFFLVSCAQGLRLGTQAGRSEDTVPWDLTQSVRQRVAALPEPAREVLGVAATAGRRASRPLLVAALGRSEETILEALEAACRARLLVEDGEDGYQFAHDVIREVVETDLGAARRTVLHRRIAEALEGGAGGVDQLPALAYHYARSGEQDKAIYYLEQAGDKARALSAHAAAEGYYRELLDRVAGLGRPLDAARVREKLSAVLRTMAHYDAALATLERAAEDYRAAGDLAALGRATAEIGQILAERGTPVEGVQRLRSLLASLEDASLSHLLAPLYMALAHLFFVSGLYSEQLAAVRRSAELARVAGDVSTLAEAELGRGYALVTLGEADEGLRVLEEAAALAETAGNLLVRGMSLHCIAVVARKRGEFERSRSYAARALEAMERRGDPANIALLLSNRGAAAFFAGDWDQARVQLERAMSMCRQIDLSWTTMYVLLDLGRLQLAVGEWEAASHCLEEAMVMVERSGDIYVRRSAQVLLAERDILQGRPVEAHVRLHPLLDRPGLDEHDVIGLLPVLAWAHLEAGDTAAAAALVAQGIARARAAKLRIALADALWVQALVTIRQGHWEEAKACLEEGLDLARSMPYPFGEGRLLHGYGLLAAGQGDRAAAHRRFEASRAIFRRLGAPKDADRVEQDLASLQG